MATKPLDATTIAEINRKAAAGIALTAPTEEKTALYNQAREAALAQKVETPVVQTPVVQTPQYQDQSGRISESYDAQLAAQVASLQNARDTANSGYQSQIEEAPKVYGEQRAGADLNTARNLQALNETSAAKGTAFTGGVASDQGGLRVAGDTQKAALTQSEINFVNNIKKAIADNNRSSSYAEIEATANMTAQKNAALATEAQNVYKAGQDTFNNNITLQNQALNVKQTEANLESIAANIRQSDAATGASLLQTEIARMEKEALADPNSPQNQTTRLALEKAKEELAQLKVAGKYTESEAKARVSEIYANIRQSNASANNSNASAAATKSEMKIKEDAAKAVTSGRIPSTADIKNAVDNIRAISGTDRSTKSYDQGGETTNTSTSLDVTKALNGLKMLEAAGWPVSYVKEAAAQLGIVINQ